MALAGDIMRYIGNEMLPVAGKTATSALSNIAPKVISNAGTNAIAKAGSNLATKAATKAGTSLLEKATALGLSKNTANKWILNTGILDTDEGVGKIKDFMNPILGGNKTPSYQRFLEQIGEGEYQMGHRPNLYIGDSETKFPLSNMEADPSYFPKIYGENREETLRNLLSLGGTGPEHQRSASIIANYHNQPDKMVKIYRQAPKDMNYGDWVGLTKEYADYHIGNHPDNQLWEREVPAGEVMFAGDDINEWGYYPKEVQLDDELGTAIDNALANNSVVSNKVEKIDQNIADFLKARGLEQTPENISMAKAMMPNNDTNIRNIPIQQVSSSENIPVNVGERQVSPRVSVAENQASLFNQLDAPSEVKIRALNYLDNPINWAENNPAFNKLTPTQRQEFADLAVKKLGNNPTTYDVNQLFDPFYKNARKENGLALFNSEENQGFLNKLGIKDYTSMKGTLANDGEHTYTLSNTTGLPHNEKITLNASVMEDMLKLQSTELHEAAHAAWLRLSPEQKVAIGQDLCNKLGLEANVGKRIANSTDLNELIAYSCEANFTSGNTVGSDGKFLDTVLSNSTAQRHLDNVAKMAGDVSPSFKERVMNVIRAFVDYIKAKIKGIKDIGTFDEFYDGLSSGDFAEDMATPIEKWSAPTKTASEQAKDELFNKLGALHKAREIPSEAFLSIDEIIRPENSIDDIMNYINQVYPDVAEKLANVVDKRVSSNILKDTLNELVASKGIDVSKDGFGKDILSAIREKVFNSPADEAQAIVDAFPKLYRTDFGVDGNDMISTLKNDGGAVLSGFAKFDGVDTGKGTRRLGISRDSFDKFFKRPENSFLANPKMEVGGSPRTGELYPNNELRNAEDVLSDLRNRVLEYYTSDPNNEELINSIPNIYGADEYVSGLLEEIAKSNSPINTINEFKMAMGPRDISSISDMDFGNTRQLIDDVQLTLANGDTISVPANSLFGNFDGIREKLYDVSKGLATENGYKYAGKTLPKEALKNDPRNAIYNKLVEDYGPEKTREIMAYYGGDIGKSAKSGQNSFLGKLLTGEEVENPLVMYHSVATDKLKAILDIAEETSNEYAIPNPSLQVVNPNVNAGSSYGDVILLGNKSIPGGIDKYSGGPDYSSKYNLYSRDVYSPRRPNIEYKNGIPTISGTRKLASPQNISDYMNKQGVKAVESQWATSGSMAATQAQRLKNPLEAIKNADLIKAQEELDEIFDDWDSELDGVIKKFLDKYMEKNPDANRFSFHDYIADELQNAMAGGPAWEGDPYGIWTNEGREVVADLKKKAANLPTAYFEAKSNRAVPLREFGGAILPEGYSDERVLKALEKSGINVLGHYDPSNYQESMKSVLKSLIKDKDRFNTKYLYSVLAGLFGLGSIIGANNSSDKSVDNVK